MQIMQSSWVAGEFAQLFVAADKAVLFVLLVKRGRLLVVPIYFCVYDLSSCAFLSRFFFLRLHQIAAADETPSGFLPVRVVREEGVFFWKPLHLVVEGAEADVIPALHGSGRTQHRCRM